MKYEVMFSVQLCMIDEKRKEHEEIKQKLFQMERQMAVMVLDRQVGLYAAKLDRYEYLMNLLSSLPTSEWHNAEKEINMLADEIYHARRNYSIVRYRALRTDYKKLATHLNDYPKAINIDFRKELKDKDLPNIYVFQGYDKLDKHIIIPDKTIKDNTHDGNIVIYPGYELYSNREYRHFYNKTSFKYLEQLSQDCMYNIDTKDLGKVRIKKK